MAVKTIGNMELDELVASGKTPIITKAIELTAGSGALKRGQLIGEVSGTFEPIDSGATPYGILCEDVDATNGASVLVYVSGHFNGNKVIGYTEDHYEALREKGIFIESAIQY